MTCKECIHKSVCYRSGSVKSDYARKCGDFVSDCEELEQEPMGVMYYPQVEGITPTVVEPNTDCISRQAAIDLADELKDDLPDDERLSDMVMSHNEGVLEYQTKLSLLPSVTPAEKVGRWIMHIDDLFPADSTMECNKCHEHQPIMIDDNYCPNCGAKMEGDINVQRRSNKNH